MRILTLAFALIALAPAFVACDDSSVDANSVPEVTGFATALEAASALKLEPLAPENDPDLHNVFRLSDNVISGSEPEGRSGLERIAKMGVKTIVSVDGKVPDAATAAALGMRYVHVPIEYRGISNEEMLEIAKTFRELPGPFYVHCFHGKHRGPAAAAIGRIVLDDIPRQRALAEMKQWCGTADTYQGLFRSVAFEAIPGSDATRSFRWDFPSAHEFQGFRHAMIEISRAHDGLKLLSKGEWKADPEHPDLDAAHEAGRLAEVFKAGAALEEIRTRPLDFRDWMTLSATQSRSLADALTRLAEGEAGARAEADRTFETLSNLCSRCHESYRNR